MIIIATDGSCHPNPGPGGWAWVDSTGAFRAGAFASGTNNIGELEAIKQALLDHENDDIEIQYDSEYAVNCITLWGPSWRRRGIMHTKKNADLIESIIMLCETRTLLGHDTTWTKVKGHTDHQLNNAADHLAGLMMRKRSDATFFGTMDVSTLNIISMIAE